MWYYGFLYSQQVNGTSNYVLVDKNITFEYTAVLQSRFSADTNDDSMQCNHGVVFCIHSNDYHINIVYLPTIINMHAITINIT